MTCLTWSDCEIWRTCLVATADKETGHVIGHVTDHVTGHVVGRVTGHVIDREIF